MSVIRFKKGEKLDLRPSQLSFTAHKETDVSMYYEFRGVYDGWLIAKYKDGSFGLRDFYVTEAWGTNGKRKFIEDFLESQERGSHE